VAELLAAQGAGVVVNGRDADAASEAAQRITGAVAHPGSAAQPAVAEALIDTCVREFGQIDILVNCAGTAGLASESIFNVTSAQFHDLLDAHLGTVFETCRAAAPKMVQRGGGAIVNTSSFAFLGDYGGTGYPAGKGGVNGLTLAIAAELKEHGVRANVVLLDLSGVTRVTEQGFFQSRSANSWLLGRALKSRVAMTVANGSVVHE